MMLNGVAENRALWSLPVKSSSCSVGVISSLSTRSSASNLEQAANILCAQANSASYPQRDGKCVVAHGPRGEDLVHWLGQWYVCVLHRGFNCSPSRAMDGRIMRHGIISSCQSAATSQIVKRCCSSLVSTAITSTQTFTFLPFFIFTYHYHSFTQNWKLTCLRLFHIVSAPLVCFCTHRTDFTDFWTCIIGSRALSFSDPYFHFTCMSVRHSVIRSVILSFCLSVRNFGAKYLGNEAR